MNSRTIIALILSVCITLAGLFFSYTYYVQHVLQNPESESMKTVIYNITVVIDYGNGTVEKHLIPKMVHPNITVFHALLAVANVSYRYYGDLVFVEEINGVYNNENNNGRYWQYWVNGEYGEVACLLYTSPSPRDRG